MDFFLLTLAIHSRIFMSINLRKYGGVLLFLGVFILNGSCNNDDSLSDSELFTGTYAGTVTYTNLDQQVTISDASVEVVQSGENYSFQFQQDIPNIEDVTMQSDGQTLMNPDATETHLIRVSQTSLQINWTVGDETWTAVCSRGGL